MLKVSEEEAMNAVLSEALSEERERERDRERERERETQQTDWNVNQNSITQHYFTEYTICHYDIRVGPRGDYGNSQRRGLQYLLNTDSNDFINGDVAIIM